MNVFEIIPGGEMDLPPLNKDLRWVTWTVGTMFVMRLLRRRN